MHNFEDNEGSRWTLSLTFGSARRVKALLDVDLLDPCAGELPLLTRLGTEIRLLCDVIFALIKPQADELGVTDEQWAAAMGGDAILSAHRAFYDELSDFFRSLGRLDVARAAAAQQKMIEMVVEGNTKRVEAIDTEKEVAEIFGASGLNSPPSPDATPGPTP